MRVILLVGGFAAVALFMAFMLLGRQPSADASTLSSMPIVQPAAIAAKAKAKADAERAK